MYVGYMGDHSIVSFFSEDGLDWSRESGSRIGNGAFPDALLLPDGRVRLYYQGPGVIQSAVSSDGGITFTLEPGIRVDRGWHGDIDPDNVGAPTTVRLADGRYRMYYRAGDEDDRWMNRLKSAILSAISGDDLNFSPEEGIRIDPQDWIDPNGPRQYQLPGRPGRRFDG